jgi:DNA-directed RNA polymerase III subunit RPC1
MTKKPVIDSTPKRVQKIDFGIFSPQDYKQLSVLECHSRDLYDISTPARPPAKFGVLDHSLGTSDKQGSCETCLENLQDCVGHFGVIRLSLPVFHIGYFRLMQSILQMICKVLFNLAYFKDLQQNHAG